MAGVEAGFGMQQSLRKTLVNMDFFLYFFFYKQK